ncbi:MAG: metallopeptidase TldD-related protein, partial [Pseudomonadota bacterium]
TSTGFTGAYRQSVHAHGVTAIAGGGVNMERDYWYTSRRHLAELQPAEEVGRIAGERAVKRFGAEPVATQTATIIFEPRSASGFVRHLLSAANGASVARKATFLAGKKGEAVYPKGISVRDNPFLSRGLASRPFDGEGLTEGAFDLVADGVLTAYLLDLASSRKLGETSNGRAGRGNGLPSPTSTNVTVHGGSGDLKSLMAEVGTGLLVTDLIGMGANVVNGNYSRGAAGFWFENGEIVRPVAEITIAGELPEMFKAARFADDAPGYYSVDAPSVAIPGMTIGGR